MADLEDSDLLSTPKRPKVSSDQEFVVQKGEVAVSRSPPVMVKYVDH